VTLVAAVQNDVQKTVPWDYLGAKVCFARIWEAA
jgi:hypothetical protein